MARKEITTPLDLKNMDNHNKNYDELYGLIDETDRRISEDMWEEIKDANTMKMLEPVQTAADLPSEEADKSLITVIDEQRVYGFVKGEWQPFNQIDLDPFEPFKTELSEIVAAYESKIQNITTEVQNTKTSAIESIESTQSQSESNINQTEQSAVSSINQTQTEAESQISTIRDEMTTQASDLTALFNDSMDKLTSKQDTALAEVDSAKQAAITEIEDFNNIDTSNWQKYKLTEDNGAFTSLDIDTDMLTLNAGNYESSGFVNDPLDDLGFYEVTVTESYNGRKVIHAIHSYTNRYFVKTIHTGGADKGWRELTSDTSGWQKHKLTEDDGYIPRMDNVDMSDLDSFMEIKSKLVYLFDPINTPTVDDDNGYLTIIARSSTYAQAIFSPINDNNIYMNNKMGSSNGWDGWELADGAKVELFNGSATGVNTVIDLVDDYNKYTSLTVYGDLLGNDFVLLANPSSTKSIFLNPNNVTDSDGNGAQMYEARLEKTTTKKLTIKNDVFYDVKNASGSGANANKITVNKIVGWK